MLLALPQLQWGFAVHRSVNRLAVFTLPPEMIPFYKRHIDIITERAVAPDQRRYTVPDEGPRHYLDVEHYGVGALDSLPRYWQDAVATLGIDTMNARGVLPWHIHRVFLRLKQAFEEQQPDRILTHSAELGHYVADAHVPLHTTVNYDGQLTDQVGIHGLWESRLPELFSNRYNLFTGKAKYLEHPQLEAWRVVKHTHSLVDSVLSTEARLNSEWGGKKYTFESKGKQVQKVVSVEYAKAYHEALGGMIEVQMRGSIKMIGDLWYTAWVDAGQPDLTRLLKRN